MLVFARSSSCLISGSDGEAEILGVLLPFILVASRKDWLVDVVPWFGSASRYGGDWLALTP